MNRIIITARMAKGLTEKQVAKELNIDVPCYKEMELGISPITNELAEALKSLYHVPSYYFTTDFTNNIQTAINALEKQKEIIQESPDFQNISISAKTHVSLAKMALDALIAKQGQILLLLQVKELLKENECLKELYESTRSIKMS